MALESGGLANKLGNRYEGNWVAKQLLDLLNEKIRSVTIEAIGDDERGVDLWIEENNGVKRAQQCKARNRSNESWSINDLKSRGVLNHLKYQLDRDPQYEFEFVSGVGARLFGDICDYARRSGNDPELFYESKIKLAGTETKNGFDTFCSALTLEPTLEDDLKKAFDYLKRSYFTLYPDDHNNRRNLQYLTGYLLTGDPVITLSTIQNYAENTDLFGMPIYPDELRSHLTEHNIHPKRLDQDTRIAPAVEELQQRFIDSIQPLLINGEIINRQETGSIKENIENGKSIIMHGRAGYGKSGVLYELIKNLEEKDIPFLPLRLDRCDPKNTAAQFGRDIGLPDCPAYSLAGFAGDRRCVLILDQLDAIRWTGAHSANALDVCKELIKHVLSLRLDGRNITVVLSCRTFDLENDPEIKNWFRDLPASDFSKIEVNELSINELKKIVGDSLVAMTERQKKILLCLQNLAIWLKLKRSDNHADFSSATELMRRFWENRRDILETQANVTPQEMDKVLIPLIDYMERNGKISAPGRITENFPKVTVALCSYGILQKSAGRLTFCHQSYLDFLIARRLLQQMDKGAKNILDWLGPKGKQSLFRREQLRQALTMLSEENSSHFLQTVQQIISANGVRFHIKQLVLDLIGQIEDISEELGEYCIFLLNNPYWREHIIETIFLGHHSYVSLLLNQGIIQKWLESENEEKINRALLILRFVAEKIPDAVTTALESFAEKQGDWPLKVLSALCWKLVDDSEPMFQLRLKLARLGYVRDFVDWKSFCQRHPLRAIQLIEAVVSTWDIESNTEKKSRRQRSRLESWYSDDITALKTVAQNNPTDTWDLLIPHIERLTAFKATPYYEPRLERWREERVRTGDTKIALGIVELVIIAGRKLISEQPEELLKRLTTLQNSISSIVQEIIIEVYAHLPASHADIGVQWLIADLSRLHLGSGYNEPEWMPTVRLIKALSSHCSEELFRKLEETIAHYYSPYEKDLTKSSLCDRHKGCFVLYMGRTQYFLLPALCKERISPSTAELIRVLKRKFARYSEDRFLRTGRITGGSVGSKLDPSIERISDRAWLDIAGKKEFSKKRLNDYRIQIGDKILESSIRQFSSSLQRIAKRFPERFGQLALRFPKDVHPQYISAIIEGFGEQKPDSKIPDEEKTSWQPANVATVEAVLDKFQSGDDRNTAMSFCRLIYERADENWSDKTIDRLIYYAKHHPDLEPGKLNISCETTADEASVDALYQNTINCVRGVAAQAIGQLLWNHTNRLERLRFCIESLVTDPHPVVRMASIDALLPILNIDRDLAVKWFCMACADDLRVAASPRAHEFFNYTIQSHFIQMGSIIRQMMYSSLDEVPEEGAKEITARWIFYGFFEKELKECRKGTIPQRKGVANAASLLLHNISYLFKCKELMSPLFNDPEKEVRTEANKIDHCDLLKESNNKEFMETYICSKAFADDPNRFIYALEDYPGSLIPLAEALFTLCKVFSTTLKEESRNIGSRIPRSASKISTLLLRLYEQSQANERKEIVNRCLDIWDLLFENRVGIVRELTNTIEK